MEKRVKTRLQYTEVKRFCPARCAERFREAPQHPATAKEVPTATGSLLKNRFYFVIEKLYNFENTFDLSLVCELFFIVA